MGEQEFNDFCGDLSSTSLPLTTITAYESLFDRLRISRDGSATGQTILLIGAAGGVGSIAIQLARRAGLTGGRGADPSPGRHRLH